MARGHNILIKCSFIVARKCNINDRRWSLHVFLCLSWVSFFAKIEPLFLVLRLSRFFHCNAIFDAKLRWRLPNSPKGVIACEQHKPSRATKFYTNYLQFNSFTQIINFMRMSKLLSMNLINTYRNGICDIKPDLQNRTNSLKNFLLNSSQRHYLFNVIKYTWSEQSNLLQTIDTKRKGDTLEKIEVVLQPFDSLNPNFFIHTRTIE